MRHRVWQTGWIVLILALGLFSRARTIGWPWWVTAYVGDTLWAWLVFLIIGWIWEHWATQRVMWCALTFAFVIEFSQLIQTPWLNSVRAQRGAALVLGQGFLWSDLICYTVGIVLGAWVERISGLHPTIDGKE